MKPSIFLLALFAILGTQDMCSRVKSRPGDVITMSSRDTTNPRTADQTELQRVKRGFKNHIRKGLGSVFKKGASSVIKKLGGVPVTGQANRAQAVTKASQHVKDFVSRLQIHRNHPGGKKFVTKFVDKIRAAASGSASARRHLKSSLSTLLELGNQGASFGASIAQILALTKSPHTSPVVISQSEPDDLTPLLLALIKPVKSDNSGSSGVQSSVFVSALTVCICGLLSQAY